MYSHDRSNPPETELAPGGEELLGALAVSPTMHLACSKYLARPFGKRKATAIFDIQLGNPPEGTHKPFTPLSPSFATICRTDGQMKCRQENGTPTAAERDFQNGCVNLPTDEDTYSTLSTFLAEKNWSLN